MMFTATYLPTCYVKDQGSNETPETPYMRQVKCNEADKEWSRKSPHADAQV